MKTKAIIKLIGIAGIATVLWVGTIGCGEDSNPGGSSWQNTSFVDSRDKQIYRTVQIGNQMWMAENLNYNVPNNTGNMCYGNIPDNCTKYGRLYNWATVMAGSSSSSSSPSRVRGICPSGWHVPSDAEWTTVVNHIGGREGAGKKFKARSGWNSNGNGNDDYGFTARPGGSRNTSTFSNAGNSGFWWTATEEGDNAWGRFMSYEHNDVNRNSSNAKTFHFALRCVKD
jgi:uncharacterized protein (TIGR02145 family)